MRYRFAFVVVLLGICLPAQAEQGVRYFEKDGLTYRETTITVREPVSEVKYKEITETVNHDRYVTEVKPHVRNAYVPITTYAWEPVVHGKWNPLSQPYVSYRPVPKVSWSVQPQTVQVPVTRRVTLPEKRIRKIPQTNLKYVEREYVQTVPVGPAATRGPASSAPPPIGSTSSLRNSSAGATVPKGFSEFRAPTQQKTEPPEFHGGVARMHSDPPRSAPSGAP